MYKSTMLLLLLLFLLPSFRGEEDNAMIKGRLKQIQHYMSGQYTRFHYDKLGRLAWVDEPYEKRISYSYFENYIFTETTYSGLEPEYDTLLTGTVHRVEKSYDERSVWRYHRNSAGDLDSVSYARKKQKKNTPRVIWHYEYFPEGSDTLNREVMGNLKKRIVKLNAAGDTLYDFHFRYIIDPVYNRVIKGMQYYNTGQLRDSVGYTYY